MTITLSCYELRETAKGLLITTVPRSRDPKPEGIWLPRSEIEHISRHPQALDMLEMEGSVHVVKMRYAPRPFVDERVVGEGKRPENYEEADEE